MKKLTIILCAVLFASFLVSCKPAGPGGNWNLIFSDEFEGNSLNLNKWRPNWLGPNDSAITKPINGGEVSCYDPHNVSVSGGTLNLRAERRNCSSWSYASGMVESRHDFLFGPPAFLEARIFVPGSGDCDNFIAFWADGTGDWPTTGENDVMECLSGHRLCFHFHSPSTGAGGCSNVGAGWHTFGAYWQANRVDYYYDGNHVGSLSSGITDDPMFLIINNGLSDDHNPIVVPTTMKVDWVRVYRPA